MKVKAKQNKAIPAKTLLLCSIPVGGIHGIRALSSTIIELTAPCPPPDVGLEEDYNMRGWARVGYPDYDHLWCGGGSQFKYELHNTVLTVWLHTGITVSITAI